MRILLVIDTLESGGAQRLFVNLANGISKIFDTWILLYNSTGEYFHKCDNNLKIIEIRKTPHRGIKLNTYIRIWKEIKRSDLIISFMPSSSIYCFLSRSFFNWNNKLICNEVSINNILESKLKRLITNFSYIKSDHIICNTKKQRDYLKNLPFLNNKVSTIYNGCKDIKFYKKEFKDNKKKKLIIIGRVAYAKNGLRLLKSLKLFHQKHNFLPKVEWAGRLDASRSKSNKLYNDMKIFLKENPIVCKNFEFIGEVKEIEDLYKNADGLISVSIFEGLPYVICEAMFSGCPVLASNISDNGIILGENSERGFLCNPLSIQSICGGLENLIFSPEEKLLDMTIKSRTFAEDHFSLQKMLNSYKNLIREFI